MEVGFNRISEDAIVSRESYYRTKWIGRRTLDRIEICRCRIRDGSMVVRRALSSPSAAWVSE